MGGSNVYGESYIGHPTVEMSPIDGDGGFILWQNAPYEWGLHMDDNAGDAARASRELRALIDAEARFLRKYMPGFETAPLSNVGRFVGTRDRHEDPRNSCLNAVLDRHTGIPITLSIVYIEVGRRAGLTIDGVNFPGHFLVRSPEIVGGGGDGLIIDPFHGGARLSEHDCRRLFQKHVELDVDFNTSLFAPATGSQAAGASPT